MRKWREDEDPWTKLWSENPWAFLVWLFVNLTSVSLAVGIFSDEPLWLRVLWGIGVMLIVFVIPFRLWLAWRARRAVRVQAQ